MMAAGRLSGASRHNLLATLYREGRGAVSVGSAHHFSLVAASENHVQSSLSLHAAAATTRRTPPPPPPQIQTAANFSTFSPINWWRERQENKEAEKYKKRVEDMAEKDVWTLGDMGDELQEAVNTWVAKLSSLSNNKEINMAKEMHRIVKGIMEVVGRDATSETIEQMTRADKLKAALAGETTVEQVNIVMQQFDAMSLMHRVVRKRKLEGKPIPQSAESMQTILQVEGPRMLSKTQKDRMMERSAKMMKKATRRR